MSNQMLLSKDPVKEPVTSSFSPSTFSPSDYSTSVCASLNQSRILEAMKTQYRLDQQVKFLSLQAETESLLQQLQALKQQRETVDLSGIVDASIEDRPAR